MNNINQNEPEEEEIPNIEQFQVGRSQHEETEHDEDEDDDYTEGEMQFADGEGTQLNEELGDIEDDEEDLD